MKIRWSRRAADSLEAYLDYISVDKPATAEKWAIRVFNKIESILEYPNIGRNVKGRPNSGLKEIIIEKDFIAVYKFNKDHCLIISFRRTSQESQKN